MLVFGNYDAQQVLENLVLDARHFALREAGSSEYLGKAALLPVSFGQIEEADHGGMKLTLNSLYLRFDKAGQAEVAVLLDSLGNEIWTELMAESLEAKPGELVHLGSWKLEILP